MGKNTHARENNTSLRTCCDTGYKAALLSFHLNLRSFNNIFNFEL